MNGRSIHFLPPRRSSQSSMCGDDKLQAIFIEPLKSSRGFF